MLTVLVAGVGVATGVGVAGGVLLGVGEGVGFELAFTLPHPARTSRAAAVTRVKENFWRKKKVNVFFTLECKRLRRWAITASFIGNNSSFTKEGGVRHTAFASHCAEPVQGGQSGALFSRERCSSSGQRCSFGGVR